MYYAFAELDRSDSVNPVQWLCCVVGCVVAELKEIAEVSTWETQPQPYCVFCLPVLDVSLLSCVHQLIQVKCSVSNICIIQQISLVFTFLMSHRDLIRPLKSQPTKNVQNHKIQKSVMVVIMTCGYRRRYVRLFPHFLGLIGCVLRFQGVHMGGCWPPGGSWRFVVNFKVQLERFVYCEPQRDSWRFLLSLKRW